MERWRAGCSTPLGVRYGPTGERSFYFGEFGNLKVLRLLENGTEMYGSSGVQGQDHGNAACSGRDAACCKDSKLCIVFLTMQLLKSGVLVSLKQRIRGYILYPECVCRRKHARLHGGNTEKVRREIKYVQHKSEQVSRRYKTGTGRTVELG